MKLKGIDQVREYLAAFKSGSKIGLSVKVTPVEKKRPAKSALKRKR